MTKTPSNITVANSYIASLITFCERKIGPEIYEQLDFVDPKQINTSDANVRLDARLYNRTVETIARKYNCPTLGLEFGAQIGAKAFNLLGYLTMSSSTLGEAASALQRYNKLVSNMGHSEINLDSDIGYAEWKNLPEVDDFSFHVVDAVLAGWCAFSRYITDKNLPLIEVDLRHNNEKHRRFYEGFYGCRINFGAQSNRLAFEKEWFNLPVAQSEKTVYQAIIAQADLALSKIEQGGFPSNSQIINLVAECLPSGDFGINAIAKKFGVSERTFQRKLSQQDITFRALLDEARKKRALALMKNGSLSLTTISGLLGFAEQSAFTRAFKRRSCQTPKQFRESN